MDRMDAPIAVMDSATAGRPPPIWRRKDHQYESETDWEGMHGAVEDMANGPAQEKNMVDSISASAVKIRPVKGKRTTRTELGHQFTPEPLLVRVFGGHR